MHTDSALFSAQGFRDNESTLRSIGWELHEVNEHGVTAKTSVLSELTTDNSRLAEQSGTVNTVFNDAVYRFTAGKLYKVKFTGENGAGLATDVWSNLFSYDDTPPDLTGGLATLCPPTGALRLDLRGTSGCGLAPNPPWDTTDLHRHQSSTSLLKVHAGAHCTCCAHPTPLYLPCKQSLIYRAAHRRHLSLSVAHFTCAGAMEGVYRPREPSRLVRAARDR